MRRLAARRVRQPRRIRGGTHPAVLARGARWPKTDGFAAFNCCFTEDPEDADDENFVRPADDRDRCLVLRRVSAAAQLSLRGGVSTPHPVSGSLGGSGGARLAWSGGTSAGMAAMPEIMTLYQYRQTSNSPATVVAGHGFGLMTGAIVEQHFDGKGGRVERFAGMLRNESLLDELSGRPGTGQRMMGLAVEEKTALVVQGNRLEVVGAGHCHVFAKRNNGRTLVWSKLDAGDRVTVDREADARRAGQLQARGIGRQPATRGWSAPTMTPTRKKWSHRPRIPPAAKKKPEPRISGSYFSSSTSMMPTSTPWPPKVWWQWTAINSLAPGFSSPAAAGRRSSGAYPLVKPPARAASSPLK